MSWLTRVANVFRSPAVDRALDEEIAFHLEARIDELVAGGMTREAAAATARRQFGNRLHVREQSHDVKSMPELEDLFRDLDHGLRGLRRAPVFASAAILTLALGIGANAAIFSIVGGVLLRPLPYPRPAQLMYLDTQLPALGLPQSMASVAEYLEFQQWNRSFAEVGAFRIGEANLVAGDRAFRVRAAIVDAHLLNTLGMPPAEGRLFRSEDGIATAPALPGESAAAAPVVLISFDLWQAAFGGRPMLGQGLDIDGRRHEVIGVTARGADLMDNHTEIWLPLGFTEEERLSRNNHDLALIGRLKDGVTVATAQAELNTLIGTWAARAGITPGPDDAGHVFLTAESGGNGHRLRMTPLVDRILGRAGRSIGVLQVAVGLVLLIACANVTNLLIGRAETRRREFAVLTALGASHGRLVRKAMAESLILALAGGSLGVVLARAGVFVLVHAYPASLPRIGGVVVDLQTMLVSLAVAVICGILFGLAPLIPARSDVTADVLKSGTPATTGPARHRLRRGLVVAETALAVVVVVGAGLLLRTVHNLTAVDAGFDRSRLLTFSITLPRASFGLLDRVRVYQGLLDELRAVPGVRGATAMTGLPLDRPYLGNQTEITNNQATSGPSIPIDYQRVMSGYFETMGIPITQGRGFERSDAGASEGGVAVVNEALSRTYWKERNPIGQRLRPAATEPWFTVIGVAKDVRQGAVDQEVGPEAYLLVDQLATDSPTTWVAFSPTTMHVVVRTELPVGTLAPTLTQVVRKVAKAVPVARLREMDEVFTDSIRRPRLLAQVVTLFAALAMLLAAIGTYGVLASMVAERRREMAVRLALGANPAQLRRLVMAHGLRLAGAGTVLGLAGILGLNRLLVSQLFGVHPTDALTLAIVLPSMIGTAALACWLPAWRASRLDPNIVLRAE